MKKIPERDKQFYDQEYIGNIWGRKITLYSFIFLVIVFLLFFISSYLGWLTPPEVPVVE